MPVYTAIREHVDAVWSETPVAWENEAFIPPGAAPWLAVEVSGTSYAQRTIGAGDALSNPWDEDGALHVRVMVPVGSGSSDARRLLKRFADHFRGAELMAGRLTFGDAALVGLDGIQDGMWFTVTANIRWRHADA